MTDAKKKEEVDTNGKQEETVDHDSSAVYIKEPETGEWIVRNPSGSTGYNYLYRDEWDYLAEEI